MNFFKVMIEKNMQDAWHYWGVKGNIAMVLNVIEAEREK